MKLFKEKFDKKIPKKNYYIVLVVSILVIIITLYIRSFYLNYKANQINNSIFYDKTINQINADDIDFIIDETPEAILYVGYTGSSKVANLERKLYREFEKKDLIDKVIYLNVTELMNDNEYIKLLRNKFPNEDIGKAPMLIYIKDGEVVDVLNSNNRMIDIKALNELLNKYGIE